MEKDQEFYVFNVVPDDEKRLELAVDAGLNINSADSIEAANKLYDFRTTPIQYLEQQLDSLSVIVRGYEMGAIVDEQPWQDHILEKYEAMSAYMGILLAQIESPEQQAS